jgi:hypothetical protein
MAERMADVIVIGAGVAGLAAARRLAIAQSRQPIDFSRVWDKIVERLDRHSGQDLSFADFLHHYCADLPPQERGLATGYVEGFDTADTGPVSAHWLRASEHALGAPAPNSHSAFPPATTASCTGWPRDSTRPTSNCD